MIFANTYIIIIINAFFNYFRIRGGRCTALVGPPERSPPLLQNSNNQCVIECQPMYNRCNLMKRRLTIRPLSLTAIHQDHYFPFTQHHRYRLPIYQMYRTVVQSDLRLVETHHDDQYHLQLMPNIIRPKRLLHFSIRQAKLRKRITKTC